MEARAALDSGAALIARVSGTVAEVDAQHITIQPEAKVKGDELGYVESYFRVSYPPTTANGRTVFTVGLTNFVQRWVIDRSVSTIALSGLTENSTFDTFAFYGTAATDSTVRPRMNIIFSPPR